MRLSRRGFAAGLFSTLAATAAAPALARPMAEGTVPHGSPCPPGVDPRVALCTGHPSGPRHPARPIGRGPWDEDWRWRHPQPRPMRPPHAGPWRGQPVEPHWPGHGPQPGPMNPGPFPPSRRG